VDAIGEAAKAYVRLRIAASVVIAPFALYVSFTSP
jgi:hypothetical protein